MPKQITSIRITSGEITWAFDADGKEVPALHGSLLELWAKYATEAGYSVEGAICEVSPMDRWRIIKGESGWTFERA